MVSVMMSSSVVLTVLAAALARRNAFLKFRRQKYFTENVKVILSSSFKIRAKIEIKEHLSVLLRTILRLKSRDMSVCRKCFSVRLFSVKTLLLISINLGGTF